MIKTRGFTIIELLVVIAIIAVLAGIVLVNVVSFINKGKDAAVKGDANTLSLYFQDYYDKNGKYYFILDTSKTFDLLNSIQAVTGRKPDGLKWFCCFSDIKNSWGCCLPLTQNTFYVGSNKKEEIIDNQCIPVTNNDICNPPPYGCTCRSE